MWSPSQFDFGSLPFQQRWMVVMPVGSLVDEVFEEDGTLGILNEAAARRVSLRRRAPAVISLVLGEEFEGGVADFADCDTGEIAWRSGGDGDVVYFHRDVVEQMLVVLEEAVQCGRIVNIASAHGLVASVRRLVVGS